MIKEDKKFKTKEKAYNYNKEYKNNINYHSISKYGNKSINTENRI